MERLIPIKDQPGLCRDTVTGEIVSTSRLETGRQVSAEVTQRVFSDIWRDVLVAALHSGRMLQVALVEADTVLEEYKKRFFQDR